MRRPSLVGQLVRDHLLVVVASCLVLVGGTWFASVTLLRKNQDDGLLEVAGSICHDVNMELEDIPEFEGAARHVFNEIQLTSSRVELIIRDGRVVASDGEMAGWTPLASWPVDDECDTLPPSVSGASSVRACFRACQAAFGIRIVTIDVLHHPESKLAAVGLLAGLPLAVAAGWSVGWVLFRRRLRPLHELRDAAARLDPDQSLALDIHSRVTELADLEGGFNELLGRIGAALDRERRFSREASHELRTPLTTLRGRLENLRKNCAADKESHAELSAALADVTSLDQLIAALLILARSESAPFAMAPVNLCDIARDVANRQAALDGKGTPAPEVRAPDEILVSGSEELLERAVRNLVDNARKYAGASARIRMTVSSANGSGILQVEDDGPGLRDDFRPLAFESFARGPVERNRVPGAGLGLAIVRAIARRHGGDVSARRTALGGEEFRIVLPLLEPASGKITIPPPPSSAT